MTKLLPILNNVITEQKALEMNPDLYSEIKLLTSELWDLKSKKFTKKTFVKSIRFKTLDGTDGLMKVYIKPRMFGMGTADTYPTYSRDPADYRMELNPKYFTSEKNVFLTIYHEFLHAIDPRMTTKFNLNLALTYDDKNDKRYWGHSYEFFTITNEFLEALKNEVELRISKLKKEKDKLVLLKSLNNILNHFKNQTPLSKLSLDILEKVNDENVSDNIFSRKLANISVEFPETADLFNKEEEPNFLILINLIKEHNPEQWNRFLSMLYKRIDFLKSKITSNKI